MSMTGTLETMNLAELLQWLANGQQTGTLIIDNGETVKKIYLRGGKILSSSSSDPKGLLGHYLVSKGVITEETLAKAIAVQEAQGKMLGGQTSNRDVVYLPDGLDEATLLSYRERIMEL